MSWPDSPALGQFHSPKSLLRAGICFVPPHGGGREVDFGPQVLGNCCELPQMERKDRISPLWEGNWCSFQRCLGVFSSDPTLGGSQPGPFHADLFSVLRGSCCVNAPEDLFAHIYLHRVIQWRPFMCFRLEAVLLASIQKERTEALPWLLRRCRKQGLDKCLHVPLLTLGWWSPSTSWYFVLGQVDMYVKQPFL